MRRLAAGLCALMLILSLAGCAPASEGEAEGSAPKGPPELHVSEDYDWTRFMGQKKEINVYNWGEYISDGTENTLNVNKEFEKLTGIKVNYTMYPTNESLYAKLQGGGSHYDIIIPSDYMISKLISEGMLAKLNYDNIPNFRHVQEQFLNPSYDPTNEYSVPYTWGYVGIVYNTLYVTPEEASSWDVLWNPKFTNQILMFDNPRDAFAIAQFLLGYSVNTTDEKELEEAAQLLRDQKSVIQMLVMDQIFNIMEAGEAYVAPYYAGDCITMIEENSDLAFSFPKEGTNLFIDAICVPKHADHKEAAEMYINFLCEPEVALANIELIQYSTPLDPVLDLLDEETAHGLSYPSDEQLENTEIFVELPDKTTSYITDLWNSVLATNEHENQLIVPVLMAVSIVGVIAVSIRRSIKKRNMQ